MMIICKHLGKYIRKHVNKYQVEATHVIFQFKIAK